MRVTLSLLMASVGSMAVCVPAFAQGAASTEPQTSDQPGNSLSDIVVTAQKRSERLQDVPVAVTALTSDDLKGSNVDGQMALPKLTPNLNFTLLSTFAAAYVRGVGTQYANPGLEASVSVYYDDTYLPRSLSAIFNFNDIERVEVLKGPQGTLYGRNATGGAIRIVTRDPKLGVFEGSMDVTLGSYSRLMVGGILNIPIGENAAIRIAAQHDQNDGFVKNISPEAARLRLEDRNVEIYSAKLLWEPTDALSIKISGDYESKHDAEGFAFKNLYNGPQQIGQVVGGCVSSGFYNVCNDAPLTEGNVEAYGIAGRIDYDLGPATLSSISSYRHLDEDDGADLDGTGAPLQHSHGITASNQFTQEVQVTSSSSGPLRYVAGLFYLHEKSYYNYYVYGDAIDQGFGPLGSAFGIGGTNILFSAQGPGLKVNSIAPYAQVDYDLTDQVTVTVGARYTWERKTLISNNPGLSIANGNYLPTPGVFVDGSLLGLVGAPGLGGNCANPGDVLCYTGGETVKFNTFTPKLTLSYKPSSALMLYITASRGFKSGGLALPAFGYVDQVKPETLDDLEGGWKYQSGPLRFNGALFYYRYKNLQMPIVNAATGTTNTRNAATARNYGAEADLTYKLSPQFEIGIGGGYLHARFRDFPNAPAFADGTPVGLVTVVVPNLKGKKLPNAPSVTGYLRAQYNVPLGSDGEIQIGSILNYRSTAYFDVANQYVDRRRALLGGRIQWISQGEKFHIGVFGENLTGKKYFTNATPLANGGFINVGAPRQIYITAGVKF